ncbi:unnamed protein product [Euphydryas editha]|uniref:Sodium channel protein Nach n=1 Tax=Euphydryas editha TaxID=104508 RepID=A0AAU9V6D4_EUPED|nr:unnamed protein product [Euphydryas editha]
MKILKSHYFNAETIMEEVHQKCEDLLLHCSFNSKKKNCNEMFNLIKTTEGHCCAFNYAALNDGNIDEISSDDDIEYYIDPSSNLKSTDIFVTSKSGRGSGLSVVFTVEPNDYPKWSMTPFNGAKILLSDPNDYPEITLSYKYVVMGQSLDIKVEPMIFQSDDAVRKISPKTRNCVFHDELSLQHTDRFSTETCKIECKMKNYVEKCGCVPYKYPKDITSRICDFEDLKCLNNLRAQTIEWDTECTPVCYIECQDKKYSITSDVMPLLADFYPRNVT